MAILDIRTVLKKKPENHTYSIEKRNLRNIHAVLKKKPTEPKKDSQRFKRTAKLDTTGIYQAFLSEID